MCAQKGCEGLCAQDLTECTGLDRVHDLTGCEKGLHMRDYEGLWLTCPGSMGYYEGLWLTCPGYAQDYEGLWWTMRGYEGL